MIPINNEILKNQTKYTPCADIFHATCDEIAQHFVEQGFRYARSRPKITLQDKDLKLEIAFWSSRSNIPGEWVNLEIIPAFYSKAVAKQNKSKGFLFGGNGILVQKNDAGSPGQVEVRQIYGDVLEGRPNQAAESVIKYHNQCNVYGIDQPKLEQIIEFIESKIVVWFDRLKTDEGISLLTTSPGKQRRNALLGKSVNSEFMDYARLKFPHLDVKANLG